VAQAAQGWALFPPLKRNWKIQTERLRYWTSAPARSREAYWVRFEARSCRLLKAAVFPQWLRAWGEVTQPCHVLSRWGTKGC
jgi:hypothetical protein